MVSLRWTFCINAIVAIAMLVVDPHMLADRRKPAQRRPRLQVSIGVNAAVRIASAMIAFLRLPDARITADRARCSGQSQQECG